MSDHTVFQEGRPRDPRIDFRSAPAKNARQPMSLLNRTGSVTAGVLAMVAASGVFVSTGRAFQNLANLFSEAEQPVEVKKALSGWGWLSDLRVSPERSANEKNESETVLERPTAADWKPFYRQAKRRVVAKKRRHHPAAAVLAQVAPKWIPASQEGPIFLTPANPAPRLVIVKATEPQAAPQDIQRMRELYWKISDERNERWIAAARVPLTIHERAVPSEADYSFETVIVAAAAPQLAVQSKQEVIKATRSAPSRSGERLRAAKVPQKVAPAAQAEVPPAEKTPTVDTKRLFADLREWTGDASAAEQPATIPASPREAQVEQPDTLVTTHSATKVDPQLNSQPPLGVTIQPQSPQPSGDQQTPYLALLKAFGGKAVSKGQTVRAPSLQRQIVSSETGDTGRQSQALTFAVTDKESSPSLEKTQDACRFEYVEGLGSFDVPTATHSVRTQEGAGGWREIHAKGHWPTLHYTLEKTPRCWPALSENTVGSVALAVDSPVQAGMGVLFGRVAAGWNVDVQDARDSQSRLRPRSQLFWGPAGEDGSRGFAWINVPPGVALVTYSQPQSENAGAVALPVESGKATHVDLSNIRETRIAGTVLNGSRKRLTPMDEVSVHAIHHPKGMTTSHEGGVFSLPSIWIAGQYPIYIETLDGKHWTHRYQVPVDSLRALQLFRIEDKDIQGWIDQIFDSTGKNVSEDLKSKSDVLSPETAVVIGSVTSAALRNHDGAIGMQVESREYKLERMPEVYSIDRSGQLRGGVPMDATARRAFMVQVPEGLSRMILVDKAQKEVRSEFFFHSPGVVSLMAPF